jgi:hypothetical protein
MGLEFRDRRRHILLDRQGLNRFEHLFGCESWLSTHGIKSPYNGTIVSILPRHSKASSGWQEPRSALATSAGLLSGWVFRTPAALLSRRQYRIIMAM